MKKLFCIILTLFGLQAQASTPVDSMRRILSSSAHDTLKMHAFIELAYEYLNTDVDSGLYYAEKGLARYRKHSNRVLAADLYSAVGMAYGYKRDFPNSLKHFQEGLKIMQSVGDKQSVAKSHFNVGLIYYYTAQYQKAVEQYLSAMKLLEEIKDRKTLPMIYNGLGSIYKDMGNYPEALKVFNRSMNMCEELKDTVMLASVCNNIGNVYDLQGEGDRALASYRRSLLLKQKIGYDRGMSSTLNNVGIIQVERGELDSALNNFNRALSYTLVNQDRVSQAVSYDGIGMVMFERGLLSQALAYFEKSIAISTAVDSKIDIISTYEKMADCYAATGDFRKAYEYQRKLIAVKDSVLHETGSKQVAEMAARYESEKKELEIQNLNKDNALKQQQLREQEIVARQQSLWIILIIGALLLMSTLAVVVYRSYRLKKQSAEIISDQKLQAERQRDLLEEKNTEITDSIYYAGRIQKALLASEAMLERNLPSYFVYYKPKDIVSGDFYWATEADGKFWLCVADCTGHGVPGAFMSLLNINFLNEAVIEKKISSPDQVLNHVRSRIISSLNPEGAAEAGRDGMDAALCMFDFKGGWLRFSCANNPLWLFRNGEMKVFVADKMPVGVHHGDQKPFTLSTLGLRKNDTIYLFSDGYADQFGGERGKKFKYKNMQRLFSEVSHLPMNEQRNRIEEVMNSWMQGMEQVDDILVIGIRV